MNPTEQKKHRRVTDELQEAFSEFSNVCVDRFLAIDRQIAAAKDEARESLGNETTHRLKLADEQRAYVDNENRIITRTIVGFIDRGFWSRLNWLITGR